MPRTSGKLRLLRLEAKLSQNSFARRADLDRATVARAESGQEISELTVAKIAMSLSDLLGRKVGLDEIVSEKPD
jgi:transcriptional regulator with XRE-family HTH domain